MGTRWRNSGRRVVRVSGIGLLAVGSVFVTGKAFGTDQPVIAVGPDALAPQTIEVHVGELIRWRAPGGEHLHLQLDAHPQAHEAVVRSGEIRAVFLLPGVHTYEMLVMTDGRKTLAGTVVVKESLGEVAIPPTCAPVSSREVCFEP